jgi:pimeloyl-ACP methyl ester carboxylesterase
VGASAEAYVAARASFLMSCDLVPLLERLTTDVPVPEPSVLTAVEADVLVIGEEGDPVHPAAVARAVAAALPRARLVLFARPASMFRERARLLGTIREHLTGPSGGTRGDRLGDAAPGSPVRE